MVQIKELSVSFDRRRVVRSFSEQFRKGEILTIIGPNGSGKSTVLRAVAKLVKREQGTVYLSGKDMAELSAKAVARQLAILMQSNECPASFTVRQLVAYGRIPHQKWYEATDPKQTRIIEWAMEATGIAHLQNRAVLTLSGGERQKVWIATALAQEPNILFLDEPTTFLDICHQLEVMHLAQRLNREHGLTVVMVLHDLNQAAQFSHRILVIRDGEIYACGKPEEVITPDMLRNVYGVEAEVRKNEITGCVCVIPTGLVPKIQAAATAPLCRKEDERRAL